VSGPYAQLHLDTARTPSALGCRGVASADRRLVFRHEGLQVELMLQPGGRAAAFVWGQIYGATSGRPCVGADVALLDETTRPVVRASTDDFGEFSFSAPRLAEGAISVETGAGRFLCWFAPADAAPSRAAPETRRA
jgi:hypothetical protein